MFRIVKVLSFRLSSSFLNTKQFYKRRIKSGIMRYTEIEVSRKLSKYGIWMWNAEVQYEEGN